MLVGSIRPEYKSNGLQESQASIFLCLNYPKDTAYTTISISYGQLCLKSTSSVALDLRQGKLPCCVMLVDMMFLCNSYMQGIRHDGI